ncbi:MAG: hypothetical protein IPL61_17630 [Myxococcales bacterium]|nr:hypothetical protein [Myxococcales bacterium]
MRRLLGFALLIALAGCPADDQGGPDATTSAGLAVGWKSDPAQIPGPVEDNLELDSAVFHLRNLRVIGDAGAGDPRTTAPVVELGWGSETSPKTVGFPDAPPGLYGRMLWTIDRGADPSAWELRGTVQIGATTEPYVIRDTEPLAIDLDFEIMAEAGVQTTIVVRAELDHALDEADFAAAPVIAGVRTIEPGDAQLPGIRAKIVDAFGVHQGDQ